MKKTFIFLILFAIVFPMAIAQNETPATEALEAGVAAAEAGTAAGDTAVVEKPQYWKFTGFVTLNFAEMMQWNWAAGGNNNGNGVLAVNLKLAYQKDNISWETTFDSDYGWMWVPSTNFKWRKSNDRMVFSTKFGWEFHKTWYLTVMAGFKSHYHKGYEYKLDDQKVEQEIYAYNWLSPSYSDLSVGIDWKPNDIFTVYLSPIAGRITTATDSRLRAKYGVPLDKTFKAELGATFKAGVSYTRIKNLKIISTLTLFTPYRGASKDPDVYVQRFGNIDVDWDLAVSYQFFKVLNVTLSTSLKYYDAVKIAYMKKGVEHFGPRVQFREIIGLGIGYSF